MIVKNSIFYVLFVACFVSAQDKEVTVEARRASVKECLKVGDYKLLVNLPLDGDQGSVKSCPKGINWIYAHNHDKSNCIEFYQIKSDLNCSKGAIVGALAGALLSYPFGKAIGLHVTAVERLAVMATFSVIGMGACAIRNIINSQKMLEISVLDHTQGKTDHYQYVWLKLGGDKAKQMKRFAKYWIQKYKYNQGEELDALMNKSGLFLDAQGRVIEITSPTALTLS